MTLKDELKTAMMELIYDESLPLSRKERIDKLIEFTVEMAHETWEQAVKDTMDAAFLQDGLITFDELGLEQDKQKFFANEVSKQ